MGEEPGNGTAAAGDEDAVATHRERLAELVAAERAIGELRGAERDLEVERIAAEVALEAARSRAPPGLDDAGALTLAEALAARHECRDALESLTGAGTRDDGEAERRGAARTALTDWLDAPRRDPRNRIPRAAHAVLVGGCVAVIWAAIAVHPVFLVILIPLGLPLGYLALSGQDTVWLRIGAERRYRATGLALPRAWDAGAVEARRAALDAEIEAGIAAQAERDRESRERAAAREDEAAREDAELAAATALADAEAAAGAALAAAGFDEDGPDPESGRWLDLVLAAHRARRDLDSVRARREALGARAEHERDAIFRFLSRRGEAPPGGQADASALAAGLERVAGADGRGPAVH